MDNSCYIPIPPENGGSSARGATAQRSGQGVPHDTHHLHPADRAHITWPACGQADDGVAGVPASSFPSRVSSNSIVRSHYSYFASSPRRMSLQETVATRGRRGKRAGRYSAVVRLDSAHTQVQPEASARRAGSEANANAAWSPERDVAWDRQAPEASAAADYSGDAREADARPTVDVSLCERVACRALSLVEQAHLIVMGVLIAVLDNMPYSTLLFPASHAQFVSLGASAILTTTAVSQIAMALFSAFPFAVGAFTIENVPFLRSISIAVIRNAAAKGLGDEWVVSTILACWIVASFLTAATFYVLGAMRLGRVADYIPHTVLLGCIGGMGLFMVTAAIGVTANCEWEWTADTLATVLSASAFPRVCLTLIVEAILIVAEVKYSSPTFTPIFLLAFPVLLYVFLFVFGIPVDAARRAGWIFDGPTLPSPASEGDQIAGLLVADGSASVLSGLGASTSLLGDAGGHTAKTTGLADLGAARLIVRETPQNNPDLSIYSHFSIRAVDWRCVASQMPSVVAIIVFSVLHAPINVPSLSLTTGVPSSLDYELKVHALASLAAAVTGGLQCYMTYSTSTLFWKCGVREHAASLLVGVGTAALMFVVPPTVILTYFPRPAAAVFMLHVGVVLVNDGLIASLSIVSFAEYIVIIFTAAFMQIAFTDGLLVGLLLAAALKLCQIIVGAMRHRGWVS
ncbi:inorganic anion transporter, sulfate permease (SulP) family protein [Besnoitia besnoiti]|uniref:Inorganic anion transporter, sulfate permease (SulP) family protein n=1 Tax=Besnoitia besnoiti TaxID=94643 RepID=A0A2A9MBT2_BESBE|nr:inorganic anion transporter, sulfate permease (SulP) family protein [Besnoitia besnoiti]PFH34684.1 inorganic anion transporter, sulfate permease (SulP) family protein [Besnoitia besnoiti]